MGTPDRTAPSPAVAGEPAATAQYAGVALHGRGGSADDIVNLGTRIGVPGMRWVAPRAPGQAWYPYRFMESLEANEPFLSAAVGSCDAAVQDASGAERLRPERLVVMGFSQGACLVTEYLLRHPGRCRAAVVFTGGLIGPPGTTWKTAGTSLDGVHVLLTGSDVDEWVPESRVRETATRLEELGARVSLQLFAGRPHVVSDAEVSLAQSFLKEVLPDTR